MFGNLYNICMKNPTGSQHIYPDGQTHYQRNKKRFILRSKKRRIANKSFLTEYKRNKKCSDCGYSNQEFPSTLDFDHKPGSVKDRELADVGGWSRERILKEISKCEIVCSNCHRIRTARRLQN